MKIMTFIMVFFLCLSGSASYGSRIPSTEVGEKYIAKPRYSYATIHALFASYKINSASNNEESSHIINVNGAMRYSEVSHIKSDTNNDLGIIDNEYNIRIFDGSILSFTDHRFATVGSLTGRPRLVLHGK